MLLSFSALTDLREAEGTDLRVHLEARKKICEAMLHHKVIKTDYPQQKAVESLLQPSVAVLVSGGDGHVDTAARK